MKLDAIVSGVLIIAAVGLAGVENITALQPQLEWILAGIALGVAGSYLLAWKSKKLVAEGAEQSIEFVQRSFAPNVVGTGNVMMVQNLMDGMRRRATKALGHSVLLFANLIDLLIKLSASLAGLIFIIFSLFGTWDPLPFIGLWILLTTLLLFLLSKGTNIIGFAVQIAHFTAPLNYAEFSKSTKKLLQKVAVASAAGWALFALQWWCFFNAFGVQLGLELFLLFALVTAFALTPFTLGGIGAMELVGLGVFSVLAVPLATTLAVMVLWEAVQLTVTYLSARSQTKKRLAQFK